MKPTDFVTIIDRYEGTATPNKVAKAMLKPITIVAEDGEYIVLSYYLGDDGAMVLDIAKKT